MENERNSSSKVIIALLSVLLVASIYFNFKLGNDTTDLNSVLETTRIEKGRVLKNLYTLRANYNEIIKENSGLSEQLIIERNKINDLIAQVERYRGNVSSLIKYKSQYFALQNKMKVIMADYEGVKKENTKLYVQRDSIQVITDKVKKENESLAYENTKLNKAVEIASKLSILNLKSKAYKVKSSGKIVDTDKAKSANMLSITFTIAENQVAEKGERTYDVQIIDTKNNVIGNRKTDNYGSDVLTYSFKKTLNYDNKTLEVAEDLPISEIASGTYFVNIFDKGQLVSKTSFVLK
jgi:uncharacterized protein (DUF3084 family)